MVNPVPKVTKDQLGQRVGKAKTELQASKVLPVLRELRDHLDKMEIPAKMGNPEGGEIQSTGKTESEVNPDVLANFFAGRIDLKIFRVVQRLQLTEIYHPTKT